MINLQSVKYGLVLALLAITFSFTLGIVFGAAETSIKNHLSKSGKAVLATVYKNDESKMKATVKKSWSYFKRAHLHGGAIGTTAVALILLLGLLAVPEKLKTLTSIALGIGSSGYSLFWMWAALRAPGMGETGLAKESLIWLAVPSAALCVIGVLLVMGSVVYSLFGKTAKASH